MKTIHSMKPVSLVAAIGSLVMSGLVAHATIYNWTNTASAAWNNAANWSPNGVPGAGDTAVMTNGIVSLSTTTTVGGIILGTNAGALTTLLLNNQTLVLNGPLTVNPSAFFTVDSGTLIGNTNAVLSGTIGWSVGSWSGILTLASGGTLNITTGNNHDWPNSTFTNNGTVLWTAGTIQAGGSPGTFIVNNGVWDAQSDWTWNNAYGGNGTTFNNAGTFRKSGSTGGNTTFVGGAAFNNTGKLDAQTNYIVLSGGGSFTGGTATNLVGFVYLNGGAFNINGTVTSTNVQLAGAVLAGNNVISGGFNWIVGDWNSSSDTIATNSTLLISTGNNHNLQNCTVTNNGTVAWREGTIQSGGTPGTLIVNNGVWDLQSDQTLNAAYGGHGTVFNNRGTFRKSGGASEFANATILAGGVMFNQLAGMIDVQNGTNGLELALQGGGNFTGGYITTNQFGLTVLSVGSFNLNGTVTGTNTWQNNGNLVGLNILKGALTWVGGVWNGAAVTIPANSLVIVIGGAGVNDMNAAVVTNSGTLKWVSGQIRGGNGTAIYNYGLWDAQSDQQLNNGYGGASLMFNNYGTFRKSGGGPEFTAATLVAGSVVFNQLAGMIDVQNGTNGLELVFQGGGNFTGGYITTNQFGLTVLSIGGFNLNGTVTGTNTWEDNGNLVGTNVITGALTWVGGNWNGAAVTIAPNSTVIVVGGGGVNDLANCVVTNNGTVKWVSGQLRGGSTPGTAVYNYGLWDAQSDYSFNNGYGGSGTVFNNFGTFRKSGGTTAGSTILSSVFLNQLAGALDVRSGNLVLQGSGNLTGGTATNNVGTLYLSLGNYTLNGLTTGNKVIENSASLVGDNVINGALTWVAGNWNGATMTILTNSTVVIAGGGGVNDLANCSLTNYGTVKWPSGGIRGGGSPLGTTLYNYGLWDAQGDYYINNGYGGVGTVFNNFGTFRKELTSGMTALQIPFNNTGKLDAQDGNIALQSSYTLANGTKMGFGLGGWLGNGSISLSGAAAFSGSLSVNLNGYFWPGVGNSFNLLNYTSETGVLFTNAVLPAPFIWQTNYNATAFAITVAGRPAMTNATPTNIYSVPINSTTLYLAWPGDHTGWRLQSQTNPLSAGLNTNWATVAGSSATNEVYMLINNTNSSVFYRMVYP